MDLGHRDFQRERHTHTRRVSYREKGNFFFFFLNRNENKRIVYFCVKTIQKTIIIVAARN